MNATVGGRVQAHWHLWAVGIVSLCWNGFGAYDYLMTVTHDGNWLASVPPAAMAIVDAFPAWAVAAGRAGPVTGAGGCSTAPSFGWCCSS